MKQPEHGTARIFGTNSIGWALIIFGGTIEVAIKSHWLCRNVNKVGDDEESPGAISVKGSSSRQRTCGSWIVQGLNLSYLQSEGTLGEEEGGDVDGKRRMGRACTRVRFNTKLQGSQNS